jgi:hypothetical protein
VGKIEKGKGGKWRGGRGSERGEGKLRNEIVADPLIQKI